MIRSMTAFGRQERQVPPGTLSWEIRSVNQRYLEVTPRLHDAFRDLETPLRERLKQRLSRGKVECTLRFRADPQAQGSVILNEPLVRMLLEAGHRLSELTGQVSSLSPQTLLTWPGVVNTPEIDVRSLHEDALTLLDATLDEFVLAREREGAELRQLLEDKLDAIVGQIMLVREALPRILAASRERLIGRLAERLADIKESANPERLEQELVLMAQKLDVDEELDRLSTHVEEVRRILKEGGAQGRRLDFLMQELNREANTLGSKSASTSTTQAAVELKVLIEQMREQVQNIE
jgi:uncharacterized protein (TIGR00255 family)